MKNYDDDFSLDLALRPEFCAAVREGMRRELTEASDLLARAIYKIQRSKIVAAELGDSTEGLTDEVLAEAMLRLKQLQRDEWRR